VQTATSTAQPAVDTATAALPPVPDVSGITSLVPPLSP